MTGHGFSYCNLSASSYSDLMLFSRHNDSPTSHNLNLYIMRQTSPELDLSIDYLNTFHSEIRSIPWHGLGDLNQDGYNEFIVWTVNNDMPSYAQILSQSYTGIDDEVSPVPEIRIYCHPNPFSQAITISLAQGASREKVKNLKIYDLKGRLVDETNILGLDAYQWNGKDSLGKPVSPEYTSYKLRTPIIRNIWPKLSG